MSQLNQLLDGFAQPAHALEVEVGGEDPRRLAGREHALGRGDHGDAAREPGSARRRLPPGFRRSGDR